MFKKGKNINLIVVVVFLSLVLFLLYLFNLNKTEISNEDSIEYVVLNDYSRFFTINSCVYKYISYLNTNKVDDILKILDKDYVNNNNINSSNIYNYINKLNGNYSFSAKKIYYEKTNKNNNIKKYYVYGHLSKDSLDLQAENLDYYLIVNLDEDNSLFSVIPYDGKIFDEVK